MVLTPLRIRWTILLSSCSLATFGPAWRGIKRPGSHGCVLICFFLLLAGSSFSLLTNIHIALWEPSLNLSISFYCFLLSFYAMWVRNRKRQILVAGWHVIYCTLITYMLRTNPSYKADTCTCTVIANMLVTKLSPQPSRAPPPVRDRLTRVYSTTSGFYHQTIPPWPLVQIVKYFCIWLQIHLR